ncbi:MAG TPA: hypothetical protein VK395_09105 [Gemmataceae bacterium]|nr:hypothetical protein [Gemmataceae bacterium]
MDADVELVFDTLYERKPSDNQSCFVVNQAGLTLLKSSESYVPLIEQVLRELVDPALSGDRSHTRTFPGLDYVLGAYMVLGVKANPDRVVGFLATLSAPLLVEAVKNIPVFFAPEGEGYSPGIAPSQELKKFVRELSKSESEDVRTAAARVMDRLIEDER